MRSPAAQPASGVAEIHVCQGRFTPDRDEAGGVTPGDRTASFHLPADVVIKGGYAGGCSPTADWRDVELFQTILSGDLNGDDQPSFANYDDNSHHVVTAFQVQGTPRLDGVTIAAGSASEGGPWPDPRTVGAGLYCLQGSPKLTNCRFVANLADCNSSGAENLGAAIFSEDGHPVLHGCLLEDNRADGSGGAIFCDGGALTMTDCNFQDNLTDAGGGAIACQDGAVVTLDGCTLGANEADGAGGAILCFGSTLHLTDCFFGVNHGHSYNGAIRCQDGSDLTAVNCDFVNNPGSGGAIGLYTNCTANLTDCWFAYHYGGCFGNGCTATLTNCDFDSCSYEGAIRNGASMTLVDCTFHGNWDTVEGGAIWNSGQLEATNCLFLDNEAHSLTWSYGDGGAVRNEGGNAEFIGCTFTDNRTVDEGGAISCEGGQITLQDCILRENEADYGSAIYSQAATIHVLGTSLLRNDASECGAAYFYQGNIWLTNCLLAGNSADAQGGAIYNSCSFLRLANCTLVDNSAEQAGGVFAGPTYMSTTRTYVDNCVLWDNRDDAGTFQISQIMTSNTALTYVNYSLIQGHDGWFGGTGNTGLAPHFLDPVGPYGDYRLTPCSPGVDAGNNAAVPAGVVTDLAGNPRFVDDPLTPDTGAGSPPLVDMSAYELVAGVAADCNGNGQPDSCEIVNGLIDDCNGNFVPDDCDIADLVSDDCNGDGVPDECEVLATFIAVSGPMSPIHYGAPQFLWLADPPPAAGDVRVSVEAIAAVSGSSEYLTLFVNGEPFGSILRETGRPCPLQPDVGTRILSAWEYNALRGDGDVILRIRPSPGVTPGACDPTFVDVTVEYETHGGGDCNANGVPDQCDAASGSSPDCNGNLVPDECEDDCNGNGIPDDCDVLSGFSEDCNGNLIPDACDVIEPIDAYSGSLWPIGAGSPQTFSLVAPPPALADVSLSFTAHADIGSPDQWIDVDVNGAAVGSVFVDGAAACSLPAVADHLFVPIQVFNDAIAGGQDAVITMTATSAVDPDGCFDPTFVTVAVAYEARSELDQNGNGVPDACECPADVNGDGTVDVLDLLAVLAAWGATTGPEDVNGDGIVDVLDLLEVLAAWGPCP